MSNYVYKGTILQRNYWKMTISWCYNRVCYKGTTLYIGCCVNLDERQQNQASNQGLTGLLR